MKTKSPLKVSRVNRALLRRIKTRILARPGQFIMEAFFSTRDSAGRPASHCGTAACLAGWAIALERLGGRPGLMRSDLFTPARPNSWIYGQKLLRLSEAQTRSLFSAGGWPKQFFDAYCEAVRNRDAKAAARAAADRIDHFLETGR